MSTRSPMNKRSQTKEVTGMARKSAASAKPARAAASSVHVVSSSSKSRRKEREKGESLAGLSREEKRARKQELRAKDDRIYTVSTLLTQDDEDYKKRRRLWWMLLGLGMLTILILWVWLFMGGTNGKVQTLPQIIAIVFAYAVIIVAFIYDFVRIRPLRNMYRAKAEGMTDKQMTALIEKAAAEEDRKRAEKAAKNGSKASDKSVDKKDDKKSK